MDAIEKVKNSLQKPLMEKGYELAEVTISRDKSGVTLHIAVDRDDPISMDDIVYVSGLINPILDNDNPMDGPYTLDVSSLGAEKPIRLERLEKYVGRYVNLHLKNPLEGKNTIEGTLEEVSEETIKVSFFLKTKKKIVDIEKSNIDKARLAIKF